MSIMISTKSGKELTKTKGTKSEDCFRLHGELFVGDLYATEDGEEEILVVSRKLTVKDLDTAAVEVL